MITTRRGLLSSLMGLLTIPAFSSKVCLTNPLTLKCPLGHETCRSIDAPIAIGNNDRYWPNVGQIFGMKLMMCDTCSVLFVQSNLESKS